MQQRPNYLSFVYKKTLYLKSLIMVGLQNGVIDASRDSKLGTDLQFPLQKYLQPTFGYAQISLRPETRVIYSLDLFRASPLSTCQ